MEFVKKKLIKFQITIYPSIMYYSGSKINPIHVFGIEPRENLFSMNAYIVSKGYHVAYHPFVFSEIYMPSAKKLDLISCVSNKLCSL